MPTPRRRNRPATGAFFFALASLLAATLAGCSSMPKIGRQKAAPTSAPVLVAPKHVEIGRIFSADSTSATAVIEFVPHFSSQIPLAGTKLIARKPDTLRPTANLVAAPYQNSRTLGAYISAGAPGIDDEVVIDPESALPEAASPAPTPPKPKGKPLVVLPAAPEPPQPRNGRR